jgi:hypothetical protein
MPDRLAGKGNEGQIGSRYATPQQDSLYCLSGPLRNHHMQPRQSGRGSPVKSTPDQGSLLIAVGASHEF